MSTKNDAVLRAGIRAAMEADGLSVEEAAGEHGPITARDPATGEAVIRVAIQASDFNVRLGIARAGEAIRDGYPHGPGGHVDGRCFLFTWADEGRRARFHETLALEIGRRHSAPAMDRVSAAVTALAAIDPEALGALVAGALADRMGFSEIHGIADRLEAVLPDPAPGRGR